MTILLGIESLSKSHGSDCLFSDLSFVLSAGDRTGIVGPNGSGKSTLLKILFGKESPDAGRITRKAGLRIACSEQSVRFPDISLEEVLLQELSSSEEGDVRVKTLLQKGGFEDFQRSAKTLSGGESKRLDILRAFVSEPDLVLLDEPTNHLDWEGTLWLLQFLEKEKGSYLIVSHDRYFLDGICTRILEINKKYPKGLLSCEGNWSRFSEAKERFFEELEEKERSLRGIVKTETEWLGRSPKARTKKAKSGVAEAEKAIRDWQDVKSRTKTETAKIDFFASERETRHLIVCRNLTKATETKTLFKGLDFTLSPGSRLGIVGRNGAGKTTLLRILANELRPDLGTVKYADDLKLVYFDQHREIPDPSLTLKEALSPSGEYVLFRGRPIHVNGWAKKFLFSKERLNMTLDRLSGGERARILLARLMLKPADVLFLDEPTNDLDIETLEVLEEALSEFPGACVLISHDRFLLDRVCTQILGIGSEEEQGLFADRKQWEEICARKKNDRGAEKKALRDPLPVPRSSSRKPSYREKKEFEELEKKIAVAEAKLAEFSRNSEVASKEKGFYEEWAVVREELDHLYEAWYAVADRFSS